MHILRSEAKDFVKKNMRYKMFFLSRRTGYSGHWRAMMRSRNSETAAQKSCLSSSWKSEELCGVVENLHTARYQDNIQQNILLLPVHRWLSKAPCMRFAGIRDLENPIAIAFCQAVLAQ
jgi:hypothetical protein